jgi:hypothetical protein
VNQTKQDIYEAALLSDACENASELRHLKHGTPERGAYIDGIYEGLHYALQRPELFRS